MAVSIPRSPERAFALQKYLLLHSQHDALQKHLTQIGTSTSDSHFDSRKSSLSNSPSVSRNASLAPQNNSPFPDSPNDIMSRSPTPNHQRRSSVSLTQAQRPRVMRRVSSFPVDDKGDAESSEDDERLEEIIQEENKLMDVNLQIKSTLMDLLACESLRGAEGNRGRMWVQTRLMEVEREIRGGKRAGLGCSG